MALNLKSLPTRLAIFYAGFLAVALFAFSVAIYSTMILAEAEEDEPASEKERELGIVRHRIFLSLAVAVPVAAGFAGAGGWFMTRRTLRSLGDIVQAASAIGPESPGKRIPCDADADREIFRLVLALNEMLSHIDRAVSGLRRFTTDAAHELRTPLAAIMGELEIALCRPRDNEKLRTTLENTLDGLRQLARLLEILLTLARSDSGELPVSASNVSVKELLSQVISPYEGLALESGLGLELVCEQPIEVRTDAVLLGRVVANLVDNACKFSPSGGRVEVRSEKRERTVAILVSDSGPGLDKEEEKRLFERFYRGARYRGSVEGFGLGLALVREFVRALHGEITIENRETGGTRATLLLPAAQ